MVNPVSYHIPWVVWLLTILVMSFLPGDQLPTFKLEWISIDKLVHFGLYFGLAVLFLIGFQAQHSKSKKRLNLSDFRLYGVLLLVGISIGYVIELIQGNYIYRRYFDVTDVLANSFGTIFGTIVYGWIGRKLI